MRTGLYTVYDTVAQEVFGGIIRAHNKEVARRSFHELLGAPNTPVSDHQKDYELIYLGDIDTSTGIITPVDLVEVIATGKDWLDANNTKDRP